MVVEQLLTLVLRAGGQKIDHLPNEHDDHANAVAGLVWVMRRDARLGQYEPPIVVPCRAVSPATLSSGEVVMAEETRADDDGDGELVSYWRSPPGWACAFERSAALVLGAAAAGQQSLGPVIRGAIVIVEFLFSAAITPIPILVARESRRAARLILCMSVR